MGRLNRVQIDVEGIVVDLPWQLGLELRERLAKADRQDLADRLAGVGASRPARLSRSEADGMLSLLERWEREIAGLRGALGTVRQT